VVRVAFWIDATSYMDHVHMHLRCSIGGRLSRDVPNPELAAYLVNKYAKKLLVSKYGLGYDAELPENAVMALEYLLIARKTSIEELDRIVVSGRTKLHTLREELGFPVNGVPVEDLFLKDISGKGFGLCSREFPRLTLYSDGDSIRVEFDVETVEKAFLKRVLDGGLEEVERRMLRGITLLGRETQEKYMMLLSRGELSTDGVAKALFKSAIQVRDKHVWLTATEWLKANGYTRQASEIIARKTICS